MTEATAKEKTNLEEENQETKEVESIEEEKEETKVLEPVANEKALTVYGQIPKIEDEIIDEVITVAEDQVLWFKPVTDGFYDPSCHIIRYNYR